MKKNSQLHLHLETELLEQLRKEAEKNYTTVAELARLKLRSTNSSQEIVMILKSIERKVYSDSKD